MPHAMGRMVQGADRLNVGRSGSVTPALYFLYVEPETLQLKDLRSLSTSEQGEMQVGPPTPPGICKDVKRKGLREGALVRV
jgi:hypothetical protein